MGKSKGTAANRPRCILHVNPLLFHHHPFSKKMIRRITYGKSRADRVHRHLVRRRAQERAPLAPSDGNLARPPGRRGRAQANSESGRVARRREWGTLREKTSAPKSWRTARPRRRTTSCVFVFALARVFSLSRLLSEADMSHVLHQRLHSIPNTAVTCSSRPLELRTARLWTTCCSSRATCGSGASEI